MGGVVAVFNRDQEPLDRSLVLAMAERGAYRGPDGVTHWLSGCVGFAHLALNATPESHYEIQPIVSDNGNIVLVTDARLDNRPELLSTLHYYLPKKEIITDADLVLAAYRKWDDDCAAFLIGDFAFVLWDGGNKRIIAARDPLGVRSLHYAVIGSDLCIATEAQQILAHPKLIPRVNELALAMWLIDRFDDNLSMFEGIERLPAGHMLVCSSSSLRVSRYWDIDPDARIYYREPLQYAEHLRELFSRCVSDRLRSDSTIIGSHMSGGMDSTSVTASAHQLLRSSGHQLAVFSWQFDTLKTCDETAYINAIANFLGLSVRFINAEQYWILDDIGKLKPSLEFPTGHGFGSLYDAMLKDLASIGGKVMLTGHAGDDMTWGTPLMHFRRFWHGNLRIAWEVALLDWKTDHRILRDLYSTFLAPALPNRFKKVIKQLIRRSPTPYPWPSWVADAAGQRLQLKQRFYSGRPRRFADQARQNIYDQVTSPDIRVGVHWHERLAASHGIEVRHPFIDRRLAEFAVAVPPSLWNEHLFPKYLLRLSMEGLLPDKVRWRRDKPDFWAYWAKGLQGERDRVFKYLAEQHAQERGLLIQKNLLDAYRLYTEMPPDRACPYIFQPLMLKMWLSEHSQVIGSTS